MATTKQLDGGMLWHRKTVGVNGWQAANGNFDILESADYCVLVSFLHEPQNEEQEFWCKRFATVAKAMEAAELM